LFVMLDAMRYHAPALDTESTWKKTAATKLRNAGVSLVFY
jgi:hypothetical protein